MGILSGGIVLLIAISSALSYANVGRQLGSFEPNGGVACTSTAFKCNDGRCIPQTWKCDGDYDCIAHEDEADCLVEKCPAEEFKCGTSGVTTNPLKGVHSMHSCIPKNWKCDGEFDCEDRSDEAGCGDDVKCKDSQFMCSEFDGKFKLCIPKTWVCDGQKDCASGADEQNCTTTKKCDDGEFDCGNGECIFGSWKCDGEDDCDNKADEASCPTDKPVKSCDQNEGMFKCASMDTCIPMEWKCDGEADCHDRSDEQGCDQATTQCKINTEFRCRSGYMCINKLWQCDGEKDCPDGSDEDDCKDYPETCPEELEQCVGSKQCLPKSVWCNGAEDCLNGYDESDCASTNLTSVRPCDEGLDYTCPQMPAMCVPYRKLCTDNSQTNCGDDSLCSSDLMLCEKGSDECQCRDGFVRGTTVCHCRDGFKPVNGKCQDVNECATPGRCDQICTNTQGSFICSCHATYTLSIRRGETIPSKCRAMGEDPLVLLSNRATIRQFDIARNEHLPLISSPGSAVAMDFHMDNGTLVWSDIALRKIMMCDIGNSNVTHHLTPKEKCGDNEQSVLVEGGSVHTPDGLAIDWVHDLLFWTDGALDTVSVMDLKTHRRRVLFNDNLEEPRAIAVDPEMGLIFWTDWGKEARIERAGMDGGHRKVILTGAYIKWPNGLALDLLSKRLYWADAKVKSIYSSDYYGNDVKVVLHSHSYLRHPFSLAVFEDRVFFTDWEHDGVISVNKFTGADVSKLMTSVQTPMTVRIYHRATQPKHENKCLFNFCGDSICLPKAMIRTSNGVEEDSVFGALPFTCVCEGDAVSDKFECLANAMAQTQGFSLPMMLLLLLVALSCVGGYMFYRQRTSPSRFSALQFDNPVYRRTTEPEGEEFRGTVGMEDIEVPVHPATIHMHHDNNSIIESMHQPLTA